MTELFPDLFEHQHGLGNNLRADAIALYNCNLILHRLKPSLFQALEQAAVCNDVLNERRESDCLIAFALGFVGDDTGIEVDRNRITRLNRVGCCFAFQDGQTNMIALR